MTDRPSLPTPERIQEIRERRSKITAPPWVADDFCEDDNDVVRVGTTDGTDTYYHRSSTIAICHHDDEDEREDGQFIGKLGAESNAQFFAHAPDDIDYLLAALDAATAERDAAERAAAVVAVDFVTVSDARDVALARAEALEAELSRLRALTTWQPIETHPKRRKVAVTWVNALGKRRTTYATYFDAGELDMDDSYSDEDRLDEEGKNANGGWFEEREAGDPGYYELNEPLDYWQPLPAPPAEDRAKEGR